MTLESILGCSVSSSLCAGFGVGTPPPLCAHKEEFKNARGIPEARNTVRNLLLDSITSYSLLPIPSTSNTRSRFRKPLPMLYSPSHKNHVEFAESIAGFCDDPRSSPFGDSGHRAGGEPSAPGDKQINDKDGHCTDPSVAAAGAANAHAGRHRL